MLFIFIIIFSVTNVYPLIFNQQKSGYYLENFFSLPQQTKYQGLGYVNNSLLNVNSLSVVNPALVCDVYYKELNIFYQPIVLGSNFLGLNFTTAVNTKSFFIPFSFSLLTLSTAKAERMNIFKESYGYEFGENVIYSNLTLSYCFKKISLNTGINFKSFIQTIDDYYNSGVNFDFGIVYPKEGYDFFWGISWLNIFPAKYKSENLVSIIRTSLNQKVGSLFFSNMTIYTELDFYNIYHIEKTTIRWGVGTSYDFFSLPVSLSLALSYYGASLGVDFTKDNLNFSYGFSFNDLGVSHRFALSYKFEFYPEEVKKVVEEQQRKIEVYKQQLLQQKSKKEKELKNLAKLYDIQQKITLNIIKSKDLINAKKYKEAKELLEDTKKLDPQDPEVLELLSIVDSYLNKETVKILYIEGLKLYQEGKYNLAKEKFLKLLDLESENKKAFIFLKLSIAHELILNKKYKEAKLELFEAVKVEPENEDVLELLRKIDTLIEVEQ